MKKIVVLMAGAFLLLNFAFAGGILTNTNQSAQFARMLSRNASIDLDAVYFNPAGLTQLKNGFYFGLHNQSIFQTKTITSEFPNLKYDKYVGDIKAPVFPTAFAVYKLDNWAFSAGFGPNGGGGCAKYDQGLPSFEKEIARMAAGYKMLTPIFTGYQIPGVTDYGVDISFEGTSVFWGIQLGATYKINEIFSVYGGARYLPSVNTYNGSIKNIEVITSGGNFPASQYQGTVKPVMDGLITTLNTTYTGIKNAIKANMLDGNATVTDPTLKATLLVLGSNAQTYNEAVISLESAETALDQLNTTNLNDKYVDTKQTGAGFTPIIGFDIHLDKLNIGLKYEHKTTLTMTNSTKVDDTNPQLFPDGEQSPGDIPAIIAGGADYQITDDLKISGSFDLYLDNKVNWGKNIYLENRTIDKNFVELAFGAEYHLSDNFALSAGYMNSNTGVSEQYQSDFSYSNDSYTVGLGFQWNLNEKLVLDAGMMLTTYKDYTKTFTEPAPLNTYTETYGKDTFSFAFGIGYKIF